VSKYSPSTVTGKEGVTMKWKLVSKSLIEHEDGHKIELKSGNWRSPLDIHPKIERGTSSIEVARLIREGLEFAYKASASDPSTIKPRQRDHNRGSGNRDSRGQNQGNRKTLSFSNR